MQLREVLSGGGEGQAGPTPEERQLEQQREEYGRRGIRYGTVHFARNVVGAYVTFNVVLQFQVCRVSFRKRTSFFRKAAKNSTRKTLVCPSAGTGVLPFRRQSET